MTTTLPDPVEALAARTQPLDPRFSQKDMHHNAHSIWYGCGEFIVLFITLFVWLLAGVICLAIHYNPTMIIIGSVLLGLWVLLILYFLFPVFRSGLPCTLPPPPPKHHPFTFPAKSDRETPPHTPINHTKIYVIYNRNSGLGKSRNIVDNVVIPRLEQICLPYTLLPTNYAGHCRDYLSSLPFEGYSAVLIVGGDGSLFEAVNGLLERKHSPTLDDKKLNDIPLGLIPAGSGNSFCADIGTWDAELALNNFLTGTALPCDVNHIQDLLSIASSSPSSLTTDTQNNNTKIAFDLSAARKRMKYPLQLPLNVYSINTCAFGLIGDLACAAENHRWLGPLRYDLCGVWWLCKKQKYPTTVLYKDNSRSCKIKYINSSHLPTLAVAEDTHNNNNTTNNNNQNNPDNNNETTILSRTEEFITLFSNNTCYFGKGHRIAPYSHLNDGFCDVTVATDASRGELMSVFNQIPSGSHVQMRHEPLTQFQTSEVAFIPYSPSSQSLDIKQIHSEYERLLSTQQTDMQISRLLTDFVNPTFSQYFSQYFITIDGEIYPFYGFLHLKTLKNSFRFITDPKQMSLANASAMLKEKTL